MKLAHLQNLPGSRQKRYAHRVGTFALAALINALPEAVHRPNIGWNKRLPWDGPPTPDFQAYEGGWSPEFKTMKLLSKISSCCSWFKSRVSQRLSALTNHCTLAAFTKPSSSAEQLTKIEVCRFQRWIGVQAEQELPNLAVQPAWDDLPPFLRRSVRQKSLSEYVFMRFLSFLHADGGLGKPYASGEQILTWLFASLNRLLQHLSCLHFFVNDGRTLGILQHLGWRFTDLRPKNTN